MHKLSFRFVAALIALGILVGCGGAPEAVGPKPTSGPDFKALLIQPGDLPAALSPGQTELGPPQQLYSGVLTSDETIFQPFLRAGEKSGSVTFLRYTDQKLRDRAYQRVLDSIGDGTKSLADIGERSAEV